MKSIMQEGSTVIKAIEKAWAAAGQPQEFSIKIFEEPKHNFIGMTTQPAKIGLFFAERIEEKEPRREKKPMKRFPEERQKPTKIIEREPVRQQPTRPVQMPEEKREKAPERTGVIWTDEMIAFGHDWLKDTLTAMNKANIPFQTSTNNYQLRFNFTEPIFEDIEQERNLFRSLSFLLLQTLKRKFKRPLRGFKIVLTRLT